MKKTIIGIPYNSNIHVWNVLLVLGILFLNSCGLVPSAQTRGERGTWIVDTRVSQNTKEHKTESITPFKAIGSTSDTISQIPQRKASIATSNGLGLKGVVAASQKLKSAKTPTQKFKSLRAITRLAKELKRPLNIKAAIKKNQTNKTKNVIPGSYSDGRKTWMSVGFFVTVFGTMLVIGLTGMEELLLLDTIVLLLVGLLLAELYLGLATDTIDEYLESVNVILSLVGLGVLTLVGMLMILEEGYELGMVMEIFAYMGWILLLVLLMYAYADM